MTFDKAVYRINLNDCSNNNELEIPDARSHIGVETTNNPETNTLTVTVHGDAYVIPIYEEMLLDQLPDVDIECDVMIGEGNRSLVDTVQD